MEINTGDNWSFNFSRTDSTIFSDVSQIEPISVSQSSAFETSTASLAIDGLRSTSSVTICSYDTDHWYKMNFDAVYCFSEVIIMQLEGWESLSGFAGSSRAYVCPHCTLWRASISVNKRILLLYSLCGIWTAPLENIYLQHAAVGLSRLSNKPILG